MMSSSVSAQPPSDTSLVTSTVIAEPESSTSNNNNNVTTNNNNSSGACKAQPGKKDGKLPPYSSFLWDEDVDGEVVNMPLAPQLITEVPPGEELDDLSDLIGPELATLVTATHDKSITIMQNMDVSSCYLDNNPGGYNADNIDFGKVWDQYTSAEHHQGPGQGCGQATGAAGPNQTFRKVIIARKIGGPGHPGGVSGPGPGGVRTEDNNNNNNNNNSGGPEPVGPVTRPPGHPGDFVTGQAQAEAGCKALLLQHRDIRSDNVTSGQQGPGPGLHQGASPGAVTSKTSNGESVTLTVVRQGDQGLARGTTHAIQISLLSISS